MSGAIEIRAFRGTRRSAVYRACVVPEPVVLRICAAARPLGLQALAAALSSPAEEVSKRDARRLADDTNVLRASGELLDVDADLVEVADVAAWCGRAPRRAWLTVRSSR